MDDLNVKLKYTNSNIKYLGELMTKLLKFIWIMLIIVFVGFSVLRISRFFNPKYYNYFFPHKISFKTALLIFILWSGWYILNGLLSGRLWWQSDQTDKKDNLFVYWLGFTLHCIVFVVCIFMLFMNFK